MPTPSPARPVRVALIGCGEHARAEHAAPLALLARDGRVELTATCDLDPARAEQVRAGYGFARAHHDLDRMLEEERPDACVVVMPVPAVAPMAERLLRRGVVCTIEKPPGDSLAAIRRLAAVAAETGTRHQVSLNRRFNPYLARAIAWAAEQGPLAYLRTSMLRRGRDEPEFIWGTGFHVIDATRHIAGEIAAWSDRPMRGRGQSAWWHDATLEFASGARGTLHVLPTCGDVLESYELFGEDWRAEVLIGRGLRYERLRAWRAGKTVIDQQPGDEPDCVRTGAFHEMAAFVDAVAAGGAMRPTLADALPSAEIAFALADRQAAASR